MRTVERSERRAFQAAILAAGCVPVGAGLAGAALGLDLAGTFPTLLGTFEGVSLDSHVRYLSGLLLGIGLAFWATARRPERHTARFRLLSAIVVLGGFFRLAGLAAVGTPPAPMLFGLVMELVVTPALCVWQGRIARGADTPGYPRKTARPPRKLSSCGGC